MTHTFLADLFSLFRRIHRDAAEAVSDKFKES